MNLIINMEDTDERFIFTDEGKMLADYGCGKFTPILVVFLRLLWAVNRAVETLPVLVDIDGTIRSWY